jgi:hypothetical protein
VLKQSRRLSQTTLEMVWLKALVQEFGMDVHSPMKMHFDNQAAIYIINYYTFHERTKHVEVDCHFIRDNVLKRVISTNFTHSEDQLIDILTKGLRSNLFDNLCNKLNMFDIYTPA